MHILYHISVFPFLFILSVCVSVVGRIGVGQKKSALIFKSDFIGVHCTLIYSCVNNSHQTAILFLCLQMVELSPGKRVYVYESHAIKAFSKKTATATVCFLLSCFFKDDELVGKSLTGRNGKECLDVDIIESIISECFPFTM